MKISRRYDTQINICDVVIAITVGGHEMQILLTLVQTFFW
jgi:hypothetical protein